MYILTLFWTGKAENDTNKKTLKNYFKSGAYKNVSTSYPLFYVAFKSIIS